MVNSIRENIISAICVRLKQITIANGYNTNIGDCNPTEPGVFRAVSDLAPEDAPACDVFPGVETVVKKYSRHECSMPLVVEAISGIGDLNSSVFQELIFADLKTCLFAMDVEIHADIEDIALAGGGPKQLASDEDTIVAAYVDLIIKYKETVGNPYTN